MTETAQAVFARLREMGIDFDYTLHEPVRTMADCGPIDARLGSVTAKNYFLRTKNRQHFYLCLVRPEARFHTADISRQAGSSRLSFAEEEYMRSLLRVYPGAVSPMGLLFDTEHRVGLLVDCALARPGKISFHPCDNTCTLAMTTADFFGKFLPGLGVEPKYVEIHDFEIKPA